MPAFRKISPHARRLRRERTEFEDRLWFALRDRRLGGFKFRFQSTVGAYVADFRCVQARLIVELDGSQHTEAKDAYRTAQLERQGYRVIRFWNNDLDQNWEGVLQTILSACEASVGPSLNPLPQAGEG